MPPGLTVDFASDARRRQWTAFLASNDLVGTPEFSVPRKPEDRPSIELLENRYERFLDVATAP